MLAIIKEKAMEPKNRMILMILFVVFFGLYIFLDFEGNTNYIVMIDNFGFTVTLVHILINMFIAILTAIMLTFSTINYSLTKKEPTGSNAIPLFTFIFGLLTFGCTSCIVAFFAAVGIAFTPLVLPHGNLIWKVVALLLVIIGYIWIMYSIEHTKCSIKE